MEPDFGNRPFSLIHYLAVKSVFEINTPEKIFLHYCYEPSGKYWDLAKRMMILNKIDAPTEIFGNKLVRYADRADVIRIQVLQQWGGIYLDMDTICVKPFGELLNYDCVMAKEEDQGLCNAVIIARNTAQFLSIWLESFRTFKGNWGTHGVVMPLTLSKIHPTLVHILPQETFFYPLWKEVEKLYEAVVLNPNAIIHHLWESSSWDKYLKDLTEEDIRSKDTTYNLIARKFLTI